MWKRKSFTQFIPSRWNLKQKKGKLFYFIFLNFPNVSCSAQFLFPPPSLSLSFLYSASNYLKEKKILISRQSLEEWKISGGRNFRLEHAKCIEPFTQNVLRPKFSFSFLFIFIFSNVCCRAAAKSNKKHRKKNWEEGSIEFY